MNVKQAYDKWAQQYDTDHNKTRDLEAKSLRDNLTNLKFESCLEIGCGTGKNTEWLITKCNEITAVDLSEEMMSYAKKKILTGKVSFIIADINNEWTFAKGKFDLVCFSLVLEHIENLEKIFERLSVVVKDGGYVYIGELHPFRQYMGTKAKFESDEGLNVVTCFNHNVSDFIQPALKNGFNVVSIKEYFDDDGSELPRILSIVMMKK